MVDRDLFSEENNVHNVDKLLGEFSKILSSHEKKKSELIGSSFYFNSVLKHRCLDCEFSSSFFSFNYIPKC